jgi:cytoskeletal protein RodZ
VAEVDLLPLEAADDAYAPSRAGAKLREAREGMGLGRAELSIRTKINERYVAAVEDSDFAALPARIYAVGFARSYAGAVGLDPAAIAAEVRRELDEHERPAQVRPVYDLDIEDPAKIPSRRIAWVAAALGIGLVVAGAVFWRSYFVPAVELPPVREDMVASTMAAPELTPAALITPTAESAAALAAPADAGATVASAPTATSPSPPARRTATPAPAAGVQSLPSPVPERLEPLPPPSASAPAATPASPPPG